MENSVRVADNGKDRRYFFRKFEDWLYLKRFLFIPHSNPSHAPLLSFGLYCLLLQVCILDTEGSSLCHFSK